MKKVYISGGNINYFHPFADTCELTDNIESADVIVFTGGEDVNPELYKQPPHYSTFYRESRDTVDICNFNYGRDNGIPMVGICRGSQFLCVMNGGELIQNVSNHAISGTHEITTLHGDTVRVTSTHHQMSNPRGNYVLLAWAEGLSNEYSMMNEYNQEYQWEPKNREEPEAIWYPDTNSLGVQFHPEYMGKDTDGWKYFQQLLQEYIL